MNIFFYKRLIKNPEIRNNLAWVLFNIWRLELVRETKVVADVSIEMLLNPAKCQCYSYYRFWSIKGKTTFGEGVVNSPLPHPD